MKSPLRFILIDDDPYNNFICRELIRLNIDFPGEITEFTKPEQAFTAISDETQDAAGLPPAFIFLDLNMPVMSGWDFLAQYNKLDEKIRNRYIIYIISSSVDPGEKQKAAAEKNVAGYIPKPIPDEFLQALEQEFLREYAGLRG